MLCTDMTLVKRNGSIITAEPLKCRSWQCEICNPLRKKKLIAEAAHGEPRTLITLTVNPALLESPEARAQALVKAWRVVRKAAKEKYNLKEFPFIAVFERTKKGEPHLHILSRVKWLDQKWLSNMMARLIGAPIVDVRHIDQARNVARYVAKYIGKDPVPFPGCKRYWRSLDYLDTPTRREWKAMLPQEKIEVWRMSVWDAEAILSRSYGPTVFDRQKHTCVCFWIGGGAGGP